MMLITLVLGTAFGAVATVLGIVSTATPYWIYTSWIYFGLWEECSAGLFSTEIKCTEVEDEWLRATQAVTVFGIICLALGTIFAVYNMKTLSKNCHLTISALSCATGGVSFAAAIVMYAVNKQESYKYFGFSFYLGIATVLCAIIATSGINVSKTVTGYSSL